MNRAFGASTHSCTQRFFSHTHTDTHINKQHNLTHFPTSKMLAFLPLLLSFLLHIIVSSSAEHSRALSVQTLLTQATWSMTRELQKSKGGDNCKPYELLA